MGRSPPFLACVRVCGDFYFTKIEFLFVYVGWLFSSRAGCKVGTEINPTAPHNQTGARDEKRGRCVLNNLGLKQSIIILPEFRWHLALTTTSSLVRVWMLFWFQFFFVNQVPNRCSLFVTIQRAIGT